MLLKKRYCKYCKKKPDAIECEWRARLYYSPCNDDCKDKIVRKIFAAWNKMDILKP